jgi:Asp-tRNA(Asn)/Glu-tRNA(Gln) amidotransferase A subunit family amidase
VLVGVKDIFHLRGFPTRAGSKLPPEELAGTEGPVVRALREAGALFVGKTATTELAYFAPAPTRNPRAPGRTPGGSSSGSAAAVAAELCDLALGTQTIGSVIRPAAFCGVAGLKPGYDRLSRDGVVPLAPSYDHVGLFAPDVDGLARAAAVLLPGWRGVEAPERGVVLGIPEGPYLDRASVAGQAHFERMAERLQALGCKVVEVPALAGFDAIESRHRELTAAEAWETHRGRFERHGELFHPKTAELIRRGREVGAAEIEAARAARGLLRAELERLMDRHGLDLWISPPAPGPPPEGLASTGDPVMNLPWTQAGMPAICLPAEASPEGPMGLQITGRFGKDEELVAWARKLAPSLGTREREADDRSGRPEKAG